MRRWIAFLLVVVCLVTTTGAFAQPGVCDGPFKGKAPTKVQFAKVLANHQAWMDSDLPESDERPANLCGANLRGANLRGVNLDGADLWGADLDGADLWGADLDGARLRWASLIKANLSGTSLGMADLSRTRLWEANLSGADLSGANLSGANLSRANLSGASLVNANLFEAELSTARLIEGDLWGANLGGARLIKADLSKARLIKANLSGARLFEADLSRANLSGADLTKASLIETNVKDAQLTDADLTEALYHARSTPDSASISGLKGLKSVRFEQGQQDGLVLLRNALQEAGLRELEREATFALEHWKTRYSPQPERFLKQLFFEATSCYGLCYERPLIIIGVFIGLFALVYLIPISNLPKYASPESGIFRIWPSGRLVAGNPDPHVEDTEEANRYHTTGPRVIGYALYFSLLSAFHFGWRDLNVGNWIARIQGQQYALRATGWVRTVSGIQSLISIYLVALWVLTYFGRPFQ